MTPATAPDATMPARGCARVSNFYTNIIAENGTPGLESKAWYTVTGLLLVFSLLMTGQSRSSGWVGVTRDTWRAVTSHSSSPTCQQSTIFMTPDDTRRLATFLLNATTIALRA